MKPDLSTIPENIPDWADLAKIIDAWPQLSDEMRKAITKMVSYLLPLSLGSIRVPFEELGEFAEVFGQKCIKTSNVVSSYSPVIFTALPEKIPDTPVAYASHSHLYQDSWKICRMNFELNQNTHHEVIVGGTCKTCVEILTICQPGFLIDRPGNVKSSMRGHPAVFEP